MAIPKLTSLKDNATASTCVHEVGQFMNELAQRYTGSKTFKEWSTLKLEDNITNINLNIDTGGSGIHNGNEVAHGNTIAYHCDGLKIIDIEPAFNALTGNYQMLITIVDSPSSPAALKAVNLLKEQHSGLTKIFKM